MFVSHGLGAVQNLCDRAAWFSHGHLMQVGRPKEVIDAYTDTVQVDRQVDEQGRHPVGLRRGPDLGRRAAGSAGRPVTRIYGGDAATFRLHYQMQQAIERPVFGLSIRTIDGFEVSGLRSRDVDCVPEKLNGVGARRRDVRSRSTPARHLRRVGVAHRLPRALHVYDLRIDVLRFDVERGAYQERPGWWRSEAVVDRSTWSRRASGRAEA